MFDVYLLEREVGLTKADISELVALLPEEGLFSPIEVVGDYSCAGGFISEEAADRISYDYAEGSALYTFVQGILNDMDLERPDCVYTMDDYGHGGTIRVLLTRDIKAALEAQKEKNHAEND